MKYNRQQRTLTHTPKKKSAERKSKWERAMEEGSFDTQLSRSIPWSTPVPWQMLHPEDAKDGWHSLSPQSFCWTPLPSQKQMKRETLGSMRFCETKSKFKIPISPSRTPKQDLIQAWNTAPYSSLFSPLQMDLKSMRIPHKGKAGQMCACIKNYEQQLMVSATLLSSFMAFVQFRMEEQQADLPVVGGKEDPQQTKDWRTIFPTTPSHLDTTSTLQ